MQDRKHHWDHVYQTKASNEVSWYQAIPVTSLQWVEELHLAKDARILDVGGGDSRFVDALLERGFSSLTVLDISAEAIARAKLRLNTRSREVDWVVSDATEFSRPNGVDFWHDRAAFHFLTNEKEIEQYVRAAASSSALGGCLVIGTFSPDGPSTCSGLEIKRYSDQQLTEQFAPFFEKIRCSEEVHQTPTGKLQKFTFCAFRKVKSPG
jgi:ubiquinone/menaquinone biosynthesis C-methylase UbiE